MKKRHHLAEVTCELCTQKHWAIGPNEEEVRMLLHHQAGHIVSGVVRVRKLTSDEAYEWERRDRRRAS